MVEMEAACSGFCILTHGVLVASYYVNAGHCGLSVNELHVSFKEAFGLERLLSVREVKIGVMMLQHSMTKREYCYIQLAPSQEDSTASLASPPTTPHT